MTSDEGSGQSVGHAWLSLSAITVADLDRSCRFYTACGFGRERDLFTAEFDAVILRLGQAGVELLKPHANTTVDHRGGLVKFVVNTPDARAVMESARSHGGVIEKPATTYEAHGGLVIGVVRDPDGYLIEFVQRPVS